MNKIHTITANTPTEFDRLVNEFNATHQVFATQTHFTRATQEGGKHIYVAVLFYREVAQ
jgi:hypothetical protein